MVQHWGEVEIGQPQEVCWITNVSLAVVEPRFYLNFLTASFFCPVPVPKHKHIQVISIPFYYCALCAWTIGFMLRPYPFSPSLQLSLSLCLSLSISLSAVCNARTLECCAVLPFSICGPRAHCPIWKNYVSKPWRFRTETVRNRWVAVGTATSEQ